MRELRVSLVLDEPVDVGVLAESDGQIYWEYDAAWQRDGVSLSPYTLPVAAGLHRHTAKPGVPLPGVFSDARPDGWGLKLLHRSFAAAGRPRSTVSPLDELAWLGARTMGALVFEPTTGPSALQEAVELGSLARHAQQVYAGHSVEALPALIRAGGSPGGARPKALVGRRGEEVFLGEGELEADVEPWLVKFPRPEDDPEAARRELAWMRLAEAAGLQVADSEVWHLGEAGEAFATRRFDRTATGRVHMLSAAGALDVDFRTAVADYRDLARLSALLCEGDQRQVAALVRWALFNVASHNDDDHLKNISWLMGAEGWRLAPAYDLTYSPAADGHRATPVLGAFRDISRDQLLHLATGAGLSTRRATCLLDEVLAGVATVDAVLSELGCVHPVSRQACEQVQTTVERLC